MKANQSTMAAVEEAVRHAHVFLETAKERILVVRQGDLPGSKLEQTRAFGELQRKGILISYQYVSPGAITIVQRRDIGEAKGGAHVRGHA